MRTLYALITAGILMLLSSAWGQAIPAIGPYKIVNTVKVGGEGGFDFVVADSDGRRLYIPRSAGANSRVTVFDLDTLKSVGEIPKTNSVHGVAIDPKSGHGYSSSKPIVMFDTKTLATIKTIEAQGNPDSILFDPATDRVFVLSHSAHRPHPEQRTEKAPRAVAETCGFRIHSPSSWWANEMWKEVAVAKGRNAAPHQRDAHVLNV